MTATLPRDFSYIKSRKRRPSEYEAVNLHIQPRLGNVWDKGNSYLRTPEGRPGFIEESTLLRHPDWHEFRDPSGLWQRPYMRMQAEQERAIARLTEDIAPTVERDIDGAWLRQVLQDLYGAWSFVEWGLFRGMFSASREGLSDTVVASMLFETFDRARHSQDIVHYLLMLEEQVPGFDGAAGKRVWLEDERFQPLRRLVEELAFGTKDWAEVIIATNLCFDAIVSEVLITRLIGRFAPVHGDVVGKLIVASFERDRRRELEWTCEFVDMVTAPEVTSAEANREIINGWVQRWTVLAVGATTPLADVYAGLPAVRTTLAEELDGALNAQTKMLAELGLEGP